MGREGKEEYLLPCLRLLLLESELVIVLGTWFLDREDVDGAVLYDGFSTVTVLYCMVA